MSGDNSNSIRSIAVATVRPYSQCATITGVVLLFDKGECSYITSVFYHHNDALENQEHLIPLLVHTLIIVLYIELFDLCDCGYTYTHIV